MTAPMITTYLAQSRSVQAVQWDGTPEALQAIQQLLAPGSPLRQTDGRVQHIGVMVTSADRHLTMTLQFVDEGGWVVREGAIVSAMTDEMFRQRYTPVGAVAAGGAQAPARSDYEREHDGGPMRPVRTQMEPVLAAGVGAPHVHDGD